MIAYGKYDCEFDFASHEWSCSSREKHIKKENVRVLFLPTFDSEYKSSKRTPDTKLGINACPSPCLPNSPAWVKAVLQLALGL